MQSELQKVLGAVIVPEINSTVSVLRFRLPHCNAQGAPSASHGLANDLNFNEDGHKDDVPALTLADVFETLQSNFFTRHIEDFSVSQTTLEQVANSV